MNRFRINVQKAKLKEKNREKNRKNGIDLTPFIEKSFENGTCVEPKTGDLQKTSCQSFLSERRF